MYFCRHNSTGLIWGQCCKKGSSSSGSCNEMGEQVLPSQEPMMQTRCSNQSPKSSEMKYFYCLVDKKEGMKSCGLKDKFANRALDIQTANRSIEVSNVKYNQGYACYYEIKTNNSWTPESRIYIYPSKLASTKLYFTNGTNRFN